MANGPLTSADAYVCDECGGVLEYSEQYPDNGLLHRDDANDTHTPVQGAEIIDVSWTCGDCTASSDAPHHDDGCPASGRSFTPATDPNLPTGLDGITTDDLLVLADVIDQVRQYTLRGGTEIIDERSHGECARILDASLEAELRANFTRILSAAGFLDLGGRHRCQP